MIPSFIAVTSFLAFMPLNPACILVAACSTSGSFKSISISSVALFSVSFCSSLITATSFLAFIPLNPACILVAACSTSGSLRSISMSFASGSVFISFTSSLPLSPVTSFAESLTFSFIADTSFLAFIPLNPAWILLAACSTSGSFRSMSISSSVLTSVSSISSFLSSCF